MNGDGHLFNRIAGFFKRVFRRKRSDNTSDFESYSRFKQFIEDLDPQDPLYPSVRQAAGLCDDALRIAKQRIAIGSNLHDLEAMLTELECFNNLTEEEIIDLRRMLDRFIALTSERSMLLNQLTDFDKSLVDLFDLEEDAVIAIPLIEEAEKHQRILRQDLGYLRGEKEDLLFENEDMHKTLLFLQRFSVAMVGLFVVVTIILAFVYIFAEQNILLPTTILILLVILIVTLLNIFQKRVRHEIRHNIRKQHRAIELLNKKTVIYVHYTNFLRYSYRKYKIKNARSLENNLQDFTKYKFVLGRIDTVRSLMYETEESIERFLRTKKLTGLKTTIESFARTLNLEDKRRYYNELHEKKVAAEKDLAVLDARHEEIWDTLMVLNDRDRSHDHIIEKIIMTYLDETGRLFEKAD